MHQLLRENTAKRPTPEAESVSKSISFAVEKILI